MCRSQPVQRILVHRLNHERAAEVTEQPDAIIRLQARINPSAMKPSKVPSNPISSTLPSPTIR